MAQEINNIAIKPIREEANSDGLSEHSKHTKPPLARILPFWSTIISVLATRQILESSNRIFKPFQKTLDSGKLTGIPKFLASNAYSLLFGTLVAATSTLYAKRNLEALKTLYSDAVGAELGKKQEDVSYGDLLFKTKNSVVRNGVKEFGRVNIFRSLTISTYFLPWHLLSKQPKKPYNIQAKVGSGFLGLYLLTNRFGKNESVLEAFQTLVDTKLHHNSDKPYDIITDNDIGNLLVTHKKSLNKSYKHPALSTQEGKNEILLAQRVADLLNNVYHNTSSEHSHFTLGKFIYLMGNNAGKTGKSFLDQEFPTNMAYIELANKYGLVEVENVAKTIENGVTVRDAFAKYDIAYNPYMENTTQNADKRPDFSKRIPSMKNGGYTNIELKPQFYAR